MLEIAIELHNGPKTKETNKKMTIILDASKIYTYNLLRGFYKILPDELILYAIGVATGVKKSDAYRVPKVSKKQKGTTSQDIKVIPQN